MAVCRARPAHSGRGGGLRTKPRRQRHSENRATDGRGLVCRHQDGEGGREQLVCNCRTEACRRTGHQRHGADLFGQVGIQSLVAQKRRLLLQHAQLCATEWGYGKLSPQRLRGHSLVCEACGRSCGRGLYRWKVSENGGLCQACRRWTAVRLGCAVTGRPQVRHRG